MMLTQHQKDVLESIDQSEGIADEFFTEIERIVGEKVAMQRAAMAGVLNDAQWEAVAKALGRLVEETE